MVTKKRNAMYMREEDLEEIFSTLSNVLAVKLIYALADYAMDGIINEVPPEAAPLYDKIREHFDHDMPRWPKD